MPQSAFATAARYSLFPHGHRLADHDGIFIVGAAVPGGFTVSMRESGCAPRLAATSTCRAGGRSQRGRIGGGDL